MAELPIRSKIQMIQDISEIIRYFELGKREEIDKLIEDLKKRSLYFEDPIQQNVLKFSEQVLFQFEYDNWHLMTGEIQKAADELIENLGFIPPK